MNHKIKIILLVSFSILLFIAVAVFFMRGKFGENMMNNDDIVKEYERIQSQFALDLPCGVTDFDSPAVKPVQCAPEKMKKGKPIKMMFRGSVTDPEGKAVVMARLNVNGSGDVYTDRDGNFSVEIKVDSIKKAINIVGDKAGYSPIRKVINAQLISQNGNEIILPAERFESLTMRQTEVQDVFLDGVRDVVITSQKYPGVSVTIPAGGLENSKGEIVTGEVIGEVAYVDPNNPEDIPFTPGFEGNIKQMVGVDRTGKQVILESSGLVFFHIKEKNSDEILQPRKGTLVTITQPILPKELEMMRDPKLIAAQQVTDEEMKKINEELGLSDSMTEEEKFSTLLDKNLVAKHYWHFNARTGLWEAWAVSGFETDIDRGVYIMKAPAFY